MFIALDGVACTSKTTILHKLINKNLPIKVHLCDYYELSKLYGFTGHSSDPLVYIGARITDLNQCDPNQIHVFDRSTVSAIAYQHIFDVNMTQESVLRECRRLTNTPLMEPWKKTLVLVSKPTQEERLVEMMKTRNNGIDVCTVEYVKNQNFFFRIWAKFFNYPMYEIDLDVSLCKQQEEIISLLLKFMNQDDE